MEETFLFLKYACLCQKNKKAQKVFSIISVIDELLSILLPVVHHILNWHTKKWKKKTPKTANTSKTLRSYPSGK